MSEKHFCTECRTEIQGASELCVGCFRKFHTACPQCMNLCSDGLYRVRRKGRPPMPIDCAYCNNERWILAR